jgi:predicted peptidase
MFPARPVHSLLQFVSVFFGVMAATSVAAAEPGTWSDRQPYSAGGKATIHYYLYAPAETGAGKTYPLVLWLHGGIKSNGVGGPNLPRGAFYQTEQQHRHPCFILRPVAVQGFNWVSPRGAGSGSHQQPQEPAVSMTLLVKLLDEVLARHPIDKQQVHVVGASMGGYGVWDIVTRWPDRFAAAIPICGGGDPSLAARLKDRRIWIFHSADDRTVPVRGSRDMFQAIMTAREEEPQIVEDDRQICASSKDGSIRYTEFKSGGHNAWDRPLGDEDVMEWVFQDNGDSGGR